MDFGNFKIFNFKYNRNFNHFNKLYPTITINIDLQLKSCFLVFALQIYQSD